MWSFFFFLFSIKPKMPPHMSKRIYNEIKDVNNDDTTPLYVYVPNEDNMRKEVYDNNKREKH